MAKSQSMARAAKRASGLGRKARVAGKHRQVAGLNVKAGKEEKGKAAENDSTRRKDETDGEAARLCRGSRQGELL